MVVLISNQQDYSGFIVLLPCRSASVLAHVIRNYSLTQSPVLIGFVNSIIRNYLVIKFLHDDSSLELFISIMMSDHIWGLAF